MILRARRRENGHLEPRKPLASKGEYTLYCKATSDGLTGIGTYDITVAQANIATATVAAIPTQQYTGSLVTPAVTVSLGSVTLPADDYEVAGYADNAGEGVILRSTTGGDITMTHTATAADYDSQLLGTDDGLSAEEVGNLSGTCYILSSSTAHGVGFYKASNTAIAANRAYYVLPSGEARARLVLNFGDEETAIRGTEFTEETEGTEVYTLQGVRIEPSAMQKGNVYIVNGRKMMKK